jgi:hypothetical protein
VEIKKNAYLLHRKWTKITKIVIITLAPVVSAERYEAFLQPCKSMRDLADEPLVAINSVLQVPSTIDGSVLKTSCEKTFVKISLMLRRGTLALL